MNSTNRETHYIAFAGQRLIWHGEFPEVVRRTREHWERSGSEPLLVFDERTSRPVEIDFRQSVETILRQFERKDGDNTKRGPGRPKLGVVAREVTLLPRHWEWLNEQPGGASVALRKLVEQARRTSGAQDELREARDSAYRFMTAMAGDLPGYEEALRALYAPDEQRFKKEITRWPKAIREHSLRLASGWFGTGSQPKGDQAHGR